MADDFIFRVQNNDFLITDDVDPKIEKLRFTRNKLRFNTGVDERYVFKAIDTNTVQGNPNGYDFANIIDFRTGLAFPTVEDLNDFLSESLGFLVPEIDLTKDSLQVTGRNPNVGLVFEDVWGAGQLSTLNYDAQTGNFTAGLVVTGTTSTASATIVIDDDSGVTGVLTIRDIKGVFQDNEELTDSSTGVADANGLASKILFRDDPTGGVGEQWEVICESANDDSAGTGAQTMGTTYLADDFSLQAEFIPLNGHTAQPFVATDSYRHRQSGILSYGSDTNGVYGKTNQGVIVIRDSVTKKIRSVIGYDSKVAGDEHGLNNSLDMLYTVPLGKESTLVKVTINTTKNNNATARALAKADGGEGWATVVENAVYQNTFSDNLEPAPRSIPVGTDIKIIARSDNEGTMLNIELFIKEKDV